MKKVTIYGLCLILMLVGSGCSTELERTTSPVTNDAKALADLKEDLNSINTSYSDTSTRGLKKWLRWIIFATADVAGIVCGGGVTGAVGASTLAWTVTKNKEQNNEKIESISDTKESSIQKTILPNSTGFIHNEISKELLKEYGGKVQVMPKAQLVDIIDVKYQEISGNVGEQIVGRQKAQQTIENVLAAFNPDISITENITEFKKFAIDDNSREALDVCAIVLEGLQYIPDTDTVYIKKVEEAVSKSPINTKLKENILEGVSVANASALLWNGDELKQALQK